MGRGPVLATMLALCTICACKAQIGATPADASQREQPDGSTTMIDAPGGSGAPDAAAPDAPLGDFAAPAPVSVASNPNIGEDDCTLSSDQLELYFAEQTAGNPKQLYRSTRTSPAGTWSTPQQIFASNNTHESPRLAPDDLTIYFGQAGDIYYATRPAKDQPWSSPQPLAQVNTPVYEKWMAVCNNGYFLISRDDNGNQDLYEGRLGAGNGAGTLSPLSTAGSDISSFLSPDCNTAYWASSTAQGTQIYTSTRPSPTGTWQAAALANFGPNFGTSNDNEDPWMSPDTRTLYFATQRNGAQKDVYFTTR